MARHLSLFLAVLLCSSIVQAADVLPGPYVAEVERVIDGDTFVAKVTVPVWLKTMMVYEITVRPRGYDTPEVYKPQCSAERERGIHAVGVLIKALVDGPALLRNIQADTSYGDRVLADVEVQGGLETLPQVMIQSGYARAYDGRGARQGWCE